MTDFTAHLEYSGVGDITEDRIDGIMTELAPYHVAVGGVAIYGINRLGVTITLPAENAEQATRSAIAIAGHAMVANSPHGIVLVGVEVLTTADWDKREGWDHVPELVSVVEAGQLLGRTPQRIRQMIDEGKFQSARRIGSSEKSGYAIARSEVDTIRGAAVAVPTDRMEGESNEDYEARITRDV
jgi:hypothetical protein